MSALPPPKSSSLMPIGDIQAMSKAISPQLFALKNESEVFTLMMLGQADGIHPITALRRYHIINGRPAMKAEAMLACFLEAGGKVKWLTRSDEAVEAEFAVNGDSPVKVRWDKARVQKAGLGGNHQKYPAQMLTARVISEGVRLVMPQVVTGIYTPEEVSEFSVAPAAATTDAGPNETAWGNAQPPAAEPATPPKQVEATVTPAKPDPKAKYDEVAAWIVSQFNPETWKRSDWSMHFPNYRDDVIERSKGLDSKLVLELRALAYYHWLSCMICTADESELTDGTWEGKVNDSGMPLARRQELMQLIDKNREAIAHAKGE